MNKLKKGYPLKVWLTTLILGSILFICTDSAINKTEENLIENPITLFFVFWIYGSIFSLPSFLLNIPICQSIAAGNLNERQAQTLIALIGIGFILLTFIVVDFSMGSGSREYTYLYMSIAYIISSVIAAFCFHLREWESIFYEENWPASTEEPL